MPGQSTPDVSQKRQARAPHTQPFGRSAFGPSDHTVLRWLGMAGFLINSRGTTHHDRPAARWFRHADHDRDAHRGSGCAARRRDPGHPQRQRPFQSCRPAGTWHRRPGVPLHGYVASLMAAGGSARARGHRHRRCVRCRPGAGQVTPADHAWQNEIPGAGTASSSAGGCLRVLAADAGRQIWAPGDSRLIPEHHLKMPAPDAMLFDFSDSDWHFGLAGAVEMANAYPNTPLLLQHWGSVAAPISRRSTATPRTCSAWS